MKKRLSSWLFGSLLAVAGLPTAALAQTASTGSPFTVTESNSYSESWTSLGSLLKNDVWTVEDKNNDNHTWDDLSTGMPTYDGSNATVTADDWLVSPPLTLTAGTAYTLETGAFCGAFNGTAQRMAVAFGTGDDPTTYTEIVPTTPITGLTLSGGATVVKAVFTPTVSGNYRIGFHAVSDQPGYLMLHQVKVSVTANTAGTPVAVSDLKLTADESGAQKVKVEFTAPTKDITDRDLTSLTSATIYRDNGALPIQTISNPTPGQKIEWTDDNVTTGNHTYTVYTSAGDLRSAKAEASIYVGGEEYPGTSDKVNVYDNLDGTIKLTWEPVIKGANGGYIDASNVKYAIFEGIYQTPIVEGLTDTEYTFNDIPLTGSQSHKIYQVVAYFDEEHLGGTAFADPFFYGTPYDFPFSESWPYGKWENGPWSASYNDTKNHFKISSQSADDDEGSLMFTPAKGGDEASIFGPKMAMGKATNARLSFQYYAYPGSKSKLQVYLDVNGQKQKLAAEVDYSTLEGMPGWRTVNVDCSDEDFKKENGYGRVIIHAISDGENIMVDDVNINDAIDYNVVTTISAPLHVQGGENADVTIHVRNVGLENAEGFSVKLHTSDGKTMTTESGTIAPGDSKDYVLSYTVPFYSENFQVWGEAEWADDENQENNISAKHTVKVVTAPYPGVNDLKAAKANNGIELNWSAPAVDNLTITESFDTYAPFLTDDVDPWTLYDADQERTNVFGGISFPGNGTPYAYTVFNCDGTTHGMSEDLTAQFKVLFGGRTGDQALLSFGNLGSAANGNNDWLISPELSGKAQTITFYVKAPQCDNANYGAEDFYVAYSTTDKASNHFTKIYSEKASDNVNWAKHTVDLPEGAKYFSIVHTSTVPVNPTGFEPAGFMVDDVTYESAPLQIVGYNVYRNSSLIANKTTDLSFVDAEGTDQDKYHVVALYNVGNAAPSNSASADPDGINTVGNTNAANGKVEVYSTSGALIGNSTKSLPAGLYIVKQGNKVEKVVVK